MPVHAHPLPAMLPNVNPVGSVSVTVTVPEVAAAPALFETVTVYVAPIWPCVKFPVCVFVMPRAGAATVRATWFE